MGAHCQCSKSTQVTIAATSDFMCHVKINRICFGQYLIKGCFPLDWLDCSYLQQDHTTLSDGQACTSWRSGAVQIWSMWAWTSSNCTFGPFQPVLTCEASRITTHFLSFHYGLKECDGYIRSGQYWMAILRLLTFTAEFLLCSSSKIWKILKVLNNQAPSELTAHPLEHFTLRLWAYWWLLECLKVEIEPLSSRPLFCGTKQTPSQLLRLKTFLFDKTYT